MKTLRKVNLTGWVFFFPLFISNISASARSGGRHPCRGKIRGKYKQCSFRKNDKPWRDEMQRASADIWKWYRGPTDLSCSDVKRGFLGVRDEIWSCSTGASCQVHGRGGKAAPLHSLCHIYQQPALQQIQLITFYFLFHILKNYEATSDSRIFFI